MSNDGLQVDDVQTLNDHDLAYYLRYPVLHDRAKEVNNAVLREVLYRIFARLEVRR